MMKQVLTGLVIAGAGIMAVPALSAETTITHATSLVEEIQYPADARHLDFVNPDAPKGGEFRQAMSTRFDSFNPFIIKGRSAPGLGAVYERLMSGHAGESGSTEYGLLAERLEYANDRSFVIFHLNPAAKWHDGKPVTADDVVFSFTTLMEKGSPQYRQYWADITNPEMLDAHKVKFTLTDTNNRELVHIIGQLPVLPKHWWQDRDFDETPTDPPLGSGPYKIGDYEIGRHIKYDRVADYWGKDHFLNKGRNNFDRLTYTYIGDQESLLTGFKGGDFDIRIENSAKRWATQYDFKAVQDGKVKTAMIDDVGPQPMQGWILNLRKEKFQNRKTRQALQYMFDFEWSNKTLMYDLYARTRSYYQNTDLAATGLPGALELEYLDKLRGQIPEEVFTTEYVPPVTNGKGRDRKGLRTAKKLLQEAGWTLKDGKLVDGKGTPFVIEFLTWSPDSKKLLLPIQQRLKVLGIEGKIRLVDTAQYINRLNSFDFDSITSVMGQSESPGNEQREYWGSEAADLQGSRNRIGIKDPAIDQLINDIIAAPDRKHLVAATRALDRVLQWNFYVVPQFHLAAWRIAWWDRFGRPDKSPGYSPDFMSWWMDPAKDAKLSRN